MEIFKKYPEIEKQFKIMYRTRRNEILANMLETDDEYKKLCDERANISMMVRDVINNTEKNLLEKYSDCIYAQEVYELDALYRQAVYDTLTILQDNGLI